MFISTLLKSFMITAKNNSMKNGAKELFITESPLSRRIRNLEDQLGYRVFIRGRDGVTLTKEGVDIYNAILPYYEELTSLEEHFIKIYKLKKKQASINLGLNVSVEYNTLDLLSDFIYSNPGVIKKVSYGVFNEDITTLLNDDDVIISGNQLIYNDDVITLAPIKKEFICLAQCKNMSAQENKTLIISDSLFNFLEKRNDGWRKWLMTAIKNTNEVKIVIIPEIINHLWLIENGGVIGLIPTSISKLINDKFKEIKTTPFLIKNTKVSMDFNAYLKKEKKEVIIDIFISKL